MMTVVNDSFAQSETHWYGRITLSLIVILVAWIVNYNMKSKGPKKTNRRTSKTIRTRGKITAPFVHTEWSEERYTYVLSQLSWSIPLIFVHRGLEGYFGSTENCIASRGEMAVEGEKSSISDWFSPFSCRSLLSNNEEVDERHDENTGVNVEFRFDRIGDRSALEVFLAGMGIPSDCWLETRRWILNRKLFVRLIAILRETDEDCDRDFLFDARRISVRQRRRR